LLPFGGAGLMNPRPGTYSTHSRANGNPELAPALLVQPSWNLV
jgi:hypothetical protein